MSVRPINVAVVGATGAVGREMLSILEERQVPVAGVKVFASPYSAGNEVLFAGRPLSVGSVTPGCFVGTEVVLGATSAEVARGWVPQAVAEGAVVIDNSTAFRMEADIPLVVPEVNPEAIEGFRQRRIVANPNCSAIELAVALEPIRRVAGISRVIVSTYQSTSGAGQRGMEALSRGVLKLYRQGGGGGAEEGDGWDEEEAGPFPHQIAFNGIPQIGSFLPDGTTTEEQKIVLESRKLLSEPSLRLSVTCVRVPWFACHALSVHLETQRALSAEEARNVLAGAPGIVVEDEPERSFYPMPFDHAGSDEVFVGRLRRDPTVEHGLVMWLVADNLRKGAALNAVQILEVLLEKYL